MVRHWRWGVILTATAVLAALPGAAHLLPAGHSSISAASLLSRVRASASVGYSGYAQSQGGLDLPVSTGDLSSTSDLLGGTNQLRVWWRGEKDWRVDTLSLTGETDLHTDSTGSWTWDYEADTAHRRPTATAPLRIPRDDDLLPANLARRLLSEAPDSSATRLPSARVAGRSAAGLRITITDKRSTIRHIDVWALPDDGLPVKVEVYGKNAEPVVATTMLDLSVSSPSAQTVAFHPPTGVKMQSTQRTNLQAGLDNFGNVQPPAEVAGLAQRTDVFLGPVGLYGRGVTELSVLPVSNDLAKQIVPSLARSAGTTDTEKPVALGAGGINLLLSAPARDGARWLLVGTVTAVTLRSALAELPSSSELDRHRRPNFVFIPNASCGAGQGGATVIIGGKSGDKSGVVKCIVFNHGNPPKRHK